MSTSQILRKRALQRARSVQFSPNIRRDFKKTYYFQPVNGNHLRKALKESVEVESVDPTLSVPRKKSLLKSHSFAYGELNRVFYTTTDPNRGRPGGNGHFPNGRILLKRKPHSVRFPSQERLDGSTCSNDLHRRSKHWVRRRPYVKAQLNGNRSEKHGDISPSNTATVQFSHRPKTSSHYGLDSSSSDSGFDSSSPTSDRKETTDITSCLLPSVGHKVLSRTDPKNVSFYLQSRPFPETLSEPDCGISEDQSNINTQTVDDSVARNINDGESKNIPSENAPHEKSANEGNHKPGAVQPEGRKPNLIKSILKSPTSNNPPKRSSVNRSKTFASQKSNCSGSADICSKPMFKKNGQVLHKSISFTMTNNIVLPCPDQESFIRPSNRTVSLGDLSCSDYQQHEGNLLYIATDPMKHSERCCKHKGYTSLSSHSFGGKVQNYPYNARWTWKPVARSRTLKTFQPKSIIVRHSPVGRHPSQRLVMYQSIGRNEAYLRLLANQLLTKEESEVFKEALHNFRVSKSIPKLCSQLRPIISTVEKMILLVEISNRLPSHLRQDFHRLCSLHFDKYSDVLNTMAPGKQFQEKAKVIAQDSTGGIRVLAKGNQKTLVFTSQADHEALRRNAASASESSLTIDQPVSEKSSLFQSDESLRMFRKSISSDNSEDTLFATRNETNNAIYSDVRTYGESKMAIYSQPMQLGSSLDSSTASESFETFRHKYDKSQIIHAQRNEPQNKGPMNHMSAVQFRPAVRHVTLTRSGGDSLGISIRGGKEHATPVTVQHVEAGSQSEKKGLTPGDIILEVNGYNFQNVPHARAVEIIKSQHNLHLTVTKARSHPVPENMPKGLGDPIPVHRLVEKDVTLTATKEGGLGFSLSGGADQTAAPIIADVFKNSPAETAGLMREDRVLKILGIDIKELTHKQIVALATSSKVLKLKIQRRIQEEARNAHYSGTIYSGNHGAPQPSNGILSLPNGDGPQFASSPVIRRKSQSSMSIDGDDKENNRGTSGPSVVSTKTRNFFNISNGQHGNHIHDAHNLKVHAAQASSNFDDGEFQTTANGRRKYVKRREQASPTVHKDSVYSTYSYRQGAPPIDSTTMEHRSHHSSTSEISKSPHSTLQKNRRPFSSFIVVPTPKLSSKDVNMKAALKDGLEKRNKALQNLRNVQPSTKDEEWKI